jgi:hypothetical protein
MQVKRAALAFLVVSALAAGPAIAKTHRRADPCAPIHKALDAGRTPAQVSKDLKVSAAQVKRCGAQRSAKADRAPK